MGLLYKKVGFLDGSVIKNPSVSAENVSVIPGSGRFPEDGNGNPLQYSCLEIAMDRRVGDNPWGHKRVRHDLATKQKQQQTKKHLTNLHTCPPVAKICVYFDNGFYRELLKS